MKFTVSGGNKNAVINLSEKREGDILYLTVNVTLPSPEIPESSNVALPSKPWQVTRFVEFQ